MIITSLLNIDLYKFTLMQVSHSSQISDCGVL